VPFHSEHICKISAGRKRIAFSAILTALFGWCLPTFAQGSGLVLKSSRPVELSLYRVLTRAAKLDKPDWSKELLRPLGKVRSDVVRDLSPGLYMVASECAASQVTVTSETVTTFTVHVLSFQRASQNLSLDSGQLAPLSCRDPLDGQVQLLPSRLDWPLLPGENTFRLAERPITVLGGKDSSVSLAALKLKPPHEFSKLSFYLMPNDSIGGQVVALPMGDFVWLLEGKYDVEINGSRRSFVLKAGEANEVPTGALRVESPPKFPMQRRLELGAQPVFAYLEGGVLLSLDQDYAVFDGEYILNLEGSELTSRVNVEPGSVTKVRTYGAQINRPKCSPVEACRFNQFVTLHRDQKTFSLLNVPFDVPFLVLNDQVEYGVEGMRGIHRLLKTSSQGVEVEGLARLRLKWEVRASVNRMRTDLVRLEPRDTQLLGKSLDLLLGRPNELVVPPGAYNLTYFLGDPQLDRSKTKIPVELRAGDTQEIVVPIYTDKEKSGESAKEVSPKAKNEEPKTLSPLR
jgi:hypothetical protein